MYRPIDIRGEFQRTLTEQKIIIDKARDENGYWMFAMGPLWYQGHVVGIYETGVDRTGYQQTRNRLFVTIAETIAAATILVVLLFLFLTYHFMSPIRVLRQSVSEMASGSWDTVVDINTRDEVSDLGDRFNIMSEYIRGYINELTGLNDSYYRFVPLKFLEFLGKRSILEVQLGDQTSREMGVLFSSIRSFYSMSARMDPEQNFNFVNAYLKRIGTVIRQNGGLIDEYLGEGIRALFPNDPEEALKAAVAMREQLRWFNEERRAGGGEPVDIGIGINWGSVRLGIIGEEQRLAGTVISDSVNLAAMLERLTEKVGASILITDGAFQLIGNRTIYLHRCLGMIRLGEKTEAVKLYDIFEGDADEVRTAKHDTKDIFERGVALFQEGSFYDARACFVDVIQQNRSDLMARIYFYLCDDYFKVGTPQGWDGSLDL
jgi:class 3 adenylate cyclase/HAMP domain-containing protein